MNPLLEQDHKVDEDMIVDGDLENKLVHDIERSEERLRQVEIETEEAVMPKGFSKIHPKKSSRNTVSLIYLIEIGARYVSRLRRITRDTIASVAQEAYLFSVWITCFLMGRRA